MSNDYGLKCPTCGNDSKFGIVAHHTITIDSDDIDHDDSLTWENDDVITCGVCNHSGPVKFFDDGE